MVRRSSIKTLPPEILESVNRALTEGERTIDEVTAHLEELGHPRSRSAVGRHAKNLSDVAERLKRSREMSQALVKEIGPEVASGKTGRLLVEILQSICFDHLLVKADDKKSDLESQDFFFLAKALKEMASAQKIDVDRELKIRSEVARETAKKAAEVAETVGNQAGLTKETINKFRGQILGVAE